MWNYFMMHVIAVFAVAQLLAANAVNLVEAEVAQPINNTLAKDATQRSNQSVSAADLEIPAAANQTNFKENDPQEIDHKDPKALEERIAPTHPISFTENKLAGENPPKNMLKSLVWAHLADKDSDLKMGSGKHEIAAGEVAVDSMENSPDAPMTHGTLDLVEDAADQEDVADLGQENQSYPSGSLLQSMPEAGASKLKKKPGSILASTINLPDAAFRDELDFGEADQDDKSYEADDGIFFESSSFVSLRHIKGVPSLMTQALFRITEEHENLGGISTIAPKGMVDSHKLFPVLVFLVLATAVGGVFYLAYIERTMIELSSQEMDRLRRRRSREAALKDRKEQKVAVEGQPEVVVRVDSLLGEIAREWESPHLSPAIDIVEDLPNPEVQPRSQGSLDNFRLPSPAHHREDPDMDLDAEYYNAESMGVLVEIPVSTSSGSLVNAYYSTAP